MRFLLAHEKDDVSKMIAFSIESAFPIQVHCVKSFQECIEYLIQDNPLQLIICNFNDDTFKLLKFLKAAKSTVPCILMNRTQKPIPPEFSMNIFDTLYWNQSPLEALDLLKKQVSKFIQAKGAVPGISNPKEGGGGEVFCKIPTDFLIRVIPLKADIYIRLSEIKFVKLFQQGDTVNEADVKTYLNERQIQYLYVRKEDCDEFISKFKTDLVSSISQEKIPASDMPKIAQSVHEMVAELGLKIGFTPALQVIITENVKNVVNGVRKEPQLSKVFSYMTQNPERYIPAHSVMTTHLSCYVAMQLGWCSDFTMEKLTFAGFLHDVTLKNPEIAALNDTHELSQSKAGFSEAEVQAYLNHPTDASKICRHFDTIPVDVDTIILQHHEGNEKFGFPRKYGLSNIAPLTAVFVVAHELVQNYFKHREPTEFLKEMNDKYRVGVFKKIMKTIHKEDLVESIAKSNSLSNIGKSN